MIASRKGTTDKGHISVLKEARTWYIWHTAQPEVRFTGRTSFEALGKYVAYHREKGKIMVPKGTYICPVNDASEMATAFPEEPGTRRHQKPLADDECMHHAAGPMDDGLLELGGDLSPLRDPDAASMS